MATERTASLLVEVGTEELPPSALRRLGWEFAAGVVDALERSQLVDGEVDYRWFATPRRLAVWVKGVCRRQPDQLVERRGPAVRAAFNDNGDPTPAALGFARSCGVDVADLDRAATDKGEWLVYRRRQKGRPAKKVLPECVEQSINRLPIPKRMRWGTLEAEFVRPVHWLVILHGAEAVEATLLSVKSTPRTLGHRFHCPHPLPLAHADDYERTLEKKGCVIADFERRGARIRRQVETLARKKGGRAGMDDALLDQVTGLVELPHALTGTFDGGFLEMPPEVLVSAMRDHQKYFHVTDETGRLLPFFITVSNIKSSAPKRVRQGNERVLKARLADARFFWDVDRKTPLAEHGARLRDVLFHRQLGTVADKVGRLERIAGALAEHCGASAARCRRAARLAKADLVTDMVGEFPELQGVMGRYYALNDGEDPDVAEACADHYKPRFSGDQLPGSETGRIVALADRLDSLVGLFAAGEAPSGDKDPYALRRAAFGVLRILVEGGPEFELEWLLEQAVQAYLATRSAEVAPDGRTARQVRDFVLDRLQAYYLERGFGADEIAAVESGRRADAGGAPAGINPADFDRRLRAVSDFRGLDAAAHLAAANKRIRNILRKADGGGDVEFDLSLSTESAERALALEMGALEQGVREDFRKARYEAGLRRLAGLKEPVDRFFDEVMVMAEDDALRNNRLALLRRLQDLFLMVADISYLQDAGDRSLGS